MRLWPFIAVLSLLLIMGVSYAGGNDMFARFGNLTAWSLSITLFTSLYALTVIIAVLALWRAHAKKIRKFVRYFSIAVTTALAVSAIYLAYWGMIGFRTWK